MCINPGQLPDGTEIACRKCWQCHENKVNDWVGRCLAESKTSHASYSITLTYGRDDDGNVDHARAAWLTYSDVQKFFKHLRADGYKFRYLVAGEYGSLKGRAHWHAILFFEGRTPPHELSTVSAKRFTNKYWPHGYQHWEEPSAASIRYVCKYIQKDMGKEERQGHLAMSKKPPLGDMFFRMLAQEYVENGLAPQNPTYQFPEVRDKKGRIQQFRITGTTLRNFIEYYKQAWAISGTRRHHPVSKMIDDHDDKQARHSTPLRLSPPPPRLERPFKATRPKVGINPDVGFKGIYCDDDLGRWWLAKNEDGYAWVREGTTSANLVGQMARSYGMTQSQSEERVEELCAMLAKWLSAVRRAVGTVRAP